MRRIIVAGLSIVAVIMVGCGIGAEKATPTPMPEQAFVSVVSVTGEVVPADAATVSAQVGGTAVEMLVEPGDEVAAGDVVIRLDPADAELAMERARTAVEAAQLRLELLQSRPRPEDVAVAEAQMKAAEPGIDQAEARLAQLKAGSLDAEIAAARAQVTLKEIDELVAYHLHEDTMTCVEVEIPGEEEKDVCPLLGPTEEKARFRLQAVREEREAARSRLQALIGQKADRLRSAELDVERAKEQQEAAEAQLAQAEAGASPEGIAAAEAALRQAEVGLQKAEAALERTEVRAPLAGTVGMVYVKEHEVVAPGQPLVLIGDLSTLRVETTDLDEIDVARVEVGRTVDVTFDALPDRVFRGRVRRIAPMAAGDGGGVNYTAVVELATLDPQIRWGMTAFVDIEVGAEAES
jgi:multidrug efflux pump subunit AcrA (membrane-fusion protein)